MGVRPMLSMRSSKQLPAEPAPVQPLVFGMKSERSRGTPGANRPKIILRPGHTLIAGARPAGLAETAAALSGRSATGSV